MTSAGPMRAFPAKWTADLGVCAVAGALAGLVRGGIVAADVISAGGEAPRTADLLHFVLRTGALHAPFGLIAGAAAALATVFRASDRPPGRAGAGATALAWGVFVFFLVGGIAADDLALADPLGVAHIGARSGGILLALGAGLWRAKSGSPGPRWILCWGLVATLAALVPLTGFVSRASLPRAQESAVRGDGEDGGPVQPDLLVLLVDTLRADHLGCYGYALRETSPTLDSLAASGVLFERAYAHWTRTAPSHASLFSGRYPHDHGLIANGQHLPERLPLLAESLSRAGYRTVAIVSNPFLGKRFGFARGFEVFTEISDLDLAGSPPSAWLRRLPLIRIADRYRDEDPATVMAEEWLERHPRSPGGRPLAFVVQWIDPHMPYRPPPGILNALSAGDYGGPLRGTRAQIDAINSGALLLDEADEAHMVARYDSEIRNVDDGIARVLRAWRRARPGESLLAVTSDHGENMHEHGQSFRHPPQVYESVARVPWLLSGSAAVGPLPVGIRVERSVEQIDFGATLLDLLDLDPHAGESLAPLVAASAVDRFLGSSRTDPGSAVVESADGATRRTALVRGRWKLVREVDPEGTRDLLYDLEAVDGESIRAMAPDTLAAMGAALDEWFDRQEGSAIELMLNPVALPDDRLDDRSIRALRALGYL